MFFFFMKFYLKKNRKKEIKMCPKLDFCGQNDIDRQTDIGLYREVALPKISGLN